MCERHPQDLFLQATLVARGLSDAWPRLTQSLGLDLSTVRNHGHDPSAAHPCAEQPSEKRKTSRVLHQDFVYQILTVVQRSLVNATSPIQFEQRRVGLVRLQLFPHASVIIVAISQARQDVIRTKLSWALASTHVDK